jgi:hypothetical protein
VRRVKGCVCRCSRRTYVELGRVDGVFWLEKQEQQVKGRGDCVEGLQMSLTMAMLERRTLFTGQWMSLEMS